jgi:hypothetical protein
VHRQIGAKRERRQRLHRQQAQEDEPRRGCQALVSGRSPSSARRPPRAPGRHLARRFGVVGHGGELIDSLVRRLRTSKSEAMSRRS